MDTLHTTNPLVMYVLSDSVGETGERVVKAAISQFECNDYEIRRKNWLTSRIQITQALHEALLTNSIVIYTIVQPDLKSFLDNTAQELGLICIDVMGPVLHALQENLKLKPRNVPGLIHKIDEEYFNKIAAIEFAVKFDDGKNPHGLLKSDLVIIGVSRTSKTPLCMYLAHKGLRTANVPLVKGVTVPQELFQIPPSKIIGLTIKPSMLIEIRKERLKTMGLQENNYYTQPEHILEELNYAQEIMTKLGCPVIDVTNKATEETASKILEIYQKTIK